MTVWLLWCGSYSDKHVVGVYSTKEKALEAKAMFENRPDSYPEDWPNDPVKEMTVDELSPELSSWLVTLDYATGDLVKAESTELTTTRATSSFWKWHRSAARGAFKGADCYCGYVLATDAEHAIKITNEKRTIHKALGEEQL